MTILLSPVFIPQDARSAYAAPPKWAVVLNNDDTTTPHFVVRVLTTIFGLSGSEAYSIMTTAHTSGRCVVRLSTLEVAETWLALTQQLSAKAEPEVDFVGDRCQLTFSLMKQ